MFKSIFSSGFKRHPFASTKRFYFGGRPKYKRFASVREPFYQTTKFKYSLGALGVFGFIFYRSNLEEVDFTGRKRFMIVSPKQEQKIAEVSYSQVISQFGSLLLSRHSMEHKYVEKVANRIIKAAGGTPEEWEINVIHSEEANAFVLPNRKIFVFTGILPITKNQDGLAVVLGHEVAHVLARHSAEQLSYAGILAIIPRLLFLFVDPATGMALGGLSKLFLELPNSRICESEADRIGLSLTAKACYNPNEAIDFWKRMERIERQYHNIELLSTHPNSGDRIEKIQMWMPEAQLQSELAGCANTGSNFLGFSSFF